MLEGGFGDFYFLFSRQGAGKVKIEVKSVRPKNNELLPSGLNHGSDNKFKTASLSALLSIWTLKNDRVLQASAQPPRTHPRYGASLGESKTCKM